jgi:hypothetical protein
VANRSTFLGDERLAWLPEAQMAIGRRLRADYETITRDPLSDRLSTLVERLARLESLAAAHKSEHE